MYTSHECGRGSYSRINIFLALLFTLSSISCTSENTSNPYYLTANIHNPPPTERTWIEPSFEKVATLSRGEEYSLLRPQALHVGEDGHLYVFDYGDNTVKSFDQKGTYLTTYGNGIGRGPGQMMSMTDRGIWRDSLLYVVDARQRRVLFFDRDSGKYVRSESYDVPLSHLAYPHDSMKYVEAAGRRSDFRRSDFLIMTTPNRQISVSRVLSRDIHPIALGGFLHTYQGRAVFVPYYFPVVLSYAPDDTTGIAYPTPDYGHVPVPEPQAENEGRGLMVRAPSHAVNGYSELIDGVLSVQYPHTSEDSIAFDLYDADDVDYLHTVRFPIQRETAVYGGGIVASSRDTTVHVYEVERLKK